MRGGDVAGIPAADGCGSRLACRHRGRRGDGVKPPRGLHVFSHQESPIVIYLAEPIEADVLRIRHEFLVAPELRLSAATAARLAGVSPAHASEMLALLEQEGFLMRADDGVYRRTEPLMA